MGYNPKKYNRRTTRLKGYDYSSLGRYFVTMCTHNRLCLFGEINDGNMVLNEWGQIARNQWLETESIRDNVALDAFVIMPNHVHGIIRITHSDRNTGSGTYYSAGAYCNTPLRRDAPHYDRNTPPSNNNVSHQGEFRSPSKTLGAIVRGYKSEVTAQINRKRSLARRYGSAIITNVLLVIYIHWNEFDIILSTIPSNGRTIEIIREYFLIFAK
ncbi:hypothetical protein Asal01_01019 [Fodinibius salicampi]